MSALLQKEEANIGDRGSFYLKKSVKIWHFLPLAIAGALISTPAYSQTSSGSDSSASANSGSISGANSQSNPTNVNAPVNNQGNLTSTSNSQSGATSGSESASSSDSRQNQSMGSMGQLSTNQQGVSVSNTFNSTNRKNSYLYTNNAIPLAASSSFSSDYCGGTASGGASAAPLGISIGGAKPVFDKSCQSLRRAEKFGMAAANASNMGQVELAGRLMSMMIWSICTADSAGAKADKSTAIACDRIGLLGSETSKQPSPAAVMDPAVRTPAGYPTPEAAARQAPTTASIDYDRARAAIVK